MSQCLVIAPVFADLSALRVVLGDLGVEITTTTELLAGAQLATVPLDMYDFAAAVLPADGPDGPLVSVLTTLYLEMGIALGRGLPLIVLAEDADAELPGIGRAASDVWMIAGVSDEADLRFHLGLFAKLAATRRLMSDSEPPPTRRPDTQEHVVENPASRALRLEQEVISLLRHSGALVEESTGLGQDAGVDAAVVIPGTEQILGPVLIEVKAHRNLDLPRATRNLAGAVIERGASLGILIYDGQPQSLRPLGRLPVVILHIDELRQVLPGPALGQWLIKVRNELMHGLRGDA